MIEPGCKCEIINSVAGNNGKIVTVGKCLGKVEGFIDYFGDMWEVDQHIRYLSGRAYNYIPEKFLKRLYDGNEKISWEECIWTPEDLYELERT